MHSHTGRNSKRNSALPGVALLWAGLVLAVFGVSRATAAPFAYVANSNSGTVSVIDTATHKVVGMPMELVGRGTDAVAVTPDGTHVYVGSTSGIVSVIDTATNTVVARVSLVDRPQGIAISPDGTRAYVSIFPRFVAVIDTTANPPKVIMTLNLGDTSGGAIAVSPDGKKVYVGCHGLGVLDTATNMVVAVPIPVGGTVGGLAVAPDGLPVYATYIAEASEGVLVIDPTTNPLGVQTIVVGNAPGGIAAAPDGTHVRLYPRCFSPYGIAVDPGGSLLYVATPALGTVSAFYIPTRRRIGVPIRVGVRPQGSTKPHPGEGPDGRPASPPALPQQPAADFAVRAARRTPPERCAGHPPREPRHSHRA
jgi:YVTN family beta-propeller protein